MTELWLLEAGVWRQTTLEEWNVANEPFDCDAMTAYWFRCKAAVAAMNKDNDERTAPVKAEMERVEGLMANYLAEHKVKNAATAHGTFYKELVVRPRATDWTAFYNWIKEHDAFQFLHKRITADEVSAFMEMHKDDDVGLPPGIAVDKEYVIRVRINTSKEK